MTMPEATTDVYYRSCARDYDIWSAGETPVANAKAPSGGKETLPDYHFRLSVLAAYAAHYPASLFWSDLIHAMRRILSYFAVALRCELVHGGIIHRKTKWIGKSRFARTSARNTT